MKNVGHYGCLTKKNCQLKGCLLRTTRFFFILLIYFVISRWIYDFLWLCYQSGVLKCYFEWKKNHHYTIRIFIVYKFERSPAFLMGIWICTASNRIKRWTFCKFNSKDSAWSLYLFWLFFIVLKQLV